MQTPWTLAVLLAVCISACNSPDAIGGSARSARPMPGITFLDAGAATLRQPAAGSLVLATPPPASTPKLNFSVPCDHTRSVESDSSALIVRDPVVLARFSLERVLAQVIETSGYAKAKSPQPKELLQRLFDTENLTADGVFADNVHCDTRLDNDPHAFVDCPRAEGALARSEGMLTPGSKDYFAPVALINRFDLAPIDASTCGEYRIVYAKESGKSDPDERVFLSFEAVLLNHGASLEDCRVVAERWSSLPTLTSATDVADRLDELFFKGISKFWPVVHAQHFGLGFDGSCTYAKCGQIRVGEGMMTPWQFRQFRLSNEASPALALPSLYFTPTQVSSSLKPARFESSRSFWQSSLVDPVLTLSEHEVPRMRLLTLSFDDAYESAVEGTAQPNFEARAVGNPSWPEIEAWLELRLTRPDVTTLTQTCPADDPLTPVSLLRRATAATCAGCHAPDRVVGPTRALGCGATQPQSLNTVHIDENGKLSDALTQVFLPYRARVLNAFLQACDAQEVEHNLQPVIPQINVECLAAGSGIRMADGSERAIEQVIAGDLVLAYDETSGAAVPATVSRAVIRRDARQLVIINGSLTATTNHAFHTTRGIRRAEELRVGDTLLRLSSADARHTEIGPTLIPIEITELTQRHAQALTYNIEVDAYHNYFADGLLVSDH